jgi:hypothetical protein
MMKLHSLLDCALFGNPSSRASDEEIHLQWSICDGNAETVLARFGEQVPAPYKRHAITYFDTMPPTHAQQGIMFHTKTNKGEYFSIIEVCFNEKPNYTSLSAECVWIAMARTSLYLRRKVSFER